MMNKVLLAIFLSLGLFFSFYHLPQQYIFEYDRERDYYQAKSIVVEHKFSLIGPTVNAFIYLGPWYNYFQVPFFILFGGDPLYGAYLIAAINFTVFILIYLIIKRLTLSRSAAILSSILWASSANRLNWSVSFVPLFFLIFIYLYEQFFRKKTLKPLLLMTLVWSLSLNIHPQMIFLAPVWFYAVFRFFRSKKQKRLKSLCYILFFFLIPLAPLIVFDLRHNFLDTRAVLHFLTSSSGSINSSISRFRLPYSLEQFSLPLALPVEWLKHNLLFSLLLIFIGTLFVVNNRHYLYLLVIPLTSIFMMSFYGQKTWPEYYHFVGGFSLMMLIFIAAGKSKHFQYLLLLCSLLIIWSNFNYLITYADPSSYYYKRQLILYMLSKNQPYDRMNIENDFPFGEGLGFGPIREYYEKPFGQYPPSLKFYVSYSGSPKHNSTKQTFGAYGVSTTY